MISLEQFATTSVTVSAQTSWSGPVGHVGDEVGLPVGESVGLSVGDALGVVVGARDGDSVGEVDGDTDGDTVGAEEGNSLGAADVGELVGARLPGAPTTLVLTSAPSKKPS